MTLNARTGRLWSEISSGLGQFDYNSQLLEIINTPMDDFSPDSMVQFYHDYILDESVYKKLLIVVYGKNKAYTLPSDEYNVIDYTHINQTANVFH